MKVMILAGANNTHTHRWVSSLAGKGIEILLFTLGKYDNWYNNLSNVKVVNCDYDVRTSVVVKLKYLMVVPKLKRVIKEFKPDILHAHYVSSFGTIGALSGFHPFIISVWGSDVYDFPHYAPFGKLLVRHNFRKADCILSTSHVMAKETRKYTNKSIEITPFGVDTNRFCKIDGLQSADEFVIGNVKTLEPKYGIDVLIHAYKIVAERNPNLKSRLVIYGKGSYHEEYERLAYNLGIGDRVEFCGFVQNDLLPNVYNSVSVSVSVSDSESFGVVAVEAMSCGCPVVVSDADGFTEVVKDGETGFIVPKRNSEATAEAIQRFIDDPTLRDKMGTRGRERVKELYEWTDNVDAMLKIYRRIIKGVK